MKSFARTVRPFALVTLSVVTAAFTISCASSKKIDWNSRVGNYTYDQAVSDMGPPDSIFFGARFFQPR